MVTVTVDAANAEDAAAVSRMKSLVRCILMFYRLIYRNERGILIGYCL